MFQIFGNLDIQIPGQMQTPKVFLLLSCILHQYRTSAKAFSVQDPPQGRFKEIVLWKACKSNKTLLFCQILKGGYIWQILFQCVLDKDPCILPYHCDLQEFCVLSSVISWQARCQFHPRYATNSAPLPLNQ